MHVPLSLRQDYGATLVEAQGGKSELPEPSETTAKAIDEYRRSAISKLESFLEAQSIQSADRSEKDGTTLIQ
jgi:hypothetical protein